MVAPLLALLLNPWVIIALAVAIVILLFGGGVFAFVVGLIFTPIRTGTVPIWALFVLGFIIILIMRRRQ